jgi:hypothetical protein
MLQAAQGDVYFRKVSEIPADAVESEFDGPVVVAHSETGHHHAFAEHSDVTYYATRNPLVSYVRVGAESILEHHRTFDTHVAFVFEPGTYELRRPREYISKAEERVIRD